MRVASVKRWTALAALVVASGMLLWAAPPKAATPPSQATGSENFVPSPAELAEALQKQPTKPSGRVYKSQITPHWFANNTRFWYRNDLRGGGKEFILVEINTDAGTRKPAFDHQKLAAALSKAGVECRADRLPFDEIAFVEEGKAISFRAGGAAWKCDLSSYECTKEKTSSLLPLLDQAAQENALAREQAEIQQRRQEEEQARAEALLPDGPSPSEEAEQTEQVALQKQPPRSDRSPDGKWTAFLKENNVYIRSGDGKEVQLSKDGAEGNSYGMLEWAGDSRTLVAFRIEPGERKDVYLIQSSPKEGGRAKLQTRPYALPGDKFTAYELNLFDVANAKQIKPEVDRTDFGRPNLRWRRDGHTFTYEKYDRGHQRFRLIEVDTHKATVRNLIDEKTETFIWSAHTEGLRNLPTVRWLQKSDEIINTTERDGWRHLYLLDARDGKVKNLITPGEFVVREVIQVDEAQRQVWYWASGKNPGQDPYFRQLYRVNFDGTGLVALTDSNGDHHQDTTQQPLKFSPDRKHLIVKYDRIDLAPVHELRRVQDGKLMCELERADDSELRANGWEPPEVFVAKGRDGKTDIWGIICRPRRLDTNKKYPVIEHIYAGPHGSHVPKRFTGTRPFTTFTDLGFIVAKCDGMGTANRSKAFHDVCWKDLKDAGFPDRILWHQAIAKKYAYYDISRVGITGGSAGGQNSTGALLFHPEFYKVAVSGCGCHDNRMDKASWNEQWMGYPVGPHYSASSNVDNAHRLKGKLLLIVGELDTNVPPESTLRVADALIRASKDFDYLVVPNVGHGNGGTYGTRRMQDYFVRHLHGVEPPNRNAGP